MRLGFGRPDPDHAASGPGLLVSLASAAATVLVLLVLAAGVAWFVYYGGGPAPKQTTVLLRKGAGVSEIAVALKRAKVIRSPSMFKAAAQLSGADRKLKAGEYEFPAHVSLSAVLQKMAAGDVVRHLVTVPEGKTSAQVVAILNAEPVLVGDAVAPPEGSILPETYEVTRGESRAAVIERMRQARDAELADLWSRRASGLPFKTPEEAVIMASVVEKETGLPNERPRVAAVFDNRLAKGMRLESDPTVIYGVSKGEPLGRGLSKTELQTATPYNTYLVAGLPPTPIANPGRAALAAVLNPARTEDLYFVADGTGGHAFASTYEQHQKNVARWRQIEAQRKTAAPSVVAVSR